MNGSIATENAAVDDVIALPSDDGRVLISLELPNVEDVQHPVLRRAIERLQAAQGPEAHKSHTSHSSHGKGTW